MRLNIKHKPETQASLSAIAFGCVCFLLFILYSDGLHTGFLELLNSNTELAIKHIAKLINAASSSIKIVSGTLSPKIYCDPRVFEFLREAKERGVKIEIIISSESVPLDRIKPNDEKLAKNFFELWGWVKKGEIKVSAVPKNPQSHFMIIDNLHVRMEDKHKITFIKTARETKRHATTSLLNPKLANKFDSKFSKLKKKAVPYSFPQKSFSVEQSVSNDG